MDWDRAYANAAFITGSANYPPKWKSDAQNFRNDIKYSAELDLAYGEKSENHYDLFYPDCPPKGLVVFIHGGFWLAFGRKDWSHFATGARAQGYAVALPSYSLAPQARLSQMTAEIGAAITAAAAKVEGPIYLIGHSAGGHLCARMVSETSPLDQSVLSRIRRAVPVSPLSDLETLTLTAMNEKLGLDADEVARESPALLARAEGPEVEVWVGGQERPAFLWQARILSEAWDCPWHIVEGRHHFDVLDELLDPHSPMSLALTAP